MHRIDADGHVANQFSDGDQVLGVPGTKVDAAWLNALQEELVSVIAARGISLVKGSNGQLLDALVRDPLRPIAWFKAYKSNTASVTVNGESGVYSISVLGSPSSSIRVTLDAVLANANFVVAGNVWNNGGKTWRVVNRTAELSEGYGAAFDIVFYDGSNLITDITSITETDFDLVVFGIFDHLPT